MNSHYDDNSVEQVRLRADIAAIIGRYTQLKGRGDSLMGCCPFHKEKTPSFSVTPSKGVYHCFGCGAGGNVFNFVMEMEGLSFKEALEKLAEETGVKLSGRSGDRPQTDSRQKMLAIHEEAADFFYRRMKGNQTVLDYFKKRGLSAETVRDFRLGYAPANWSELCDHFKNGGTPLSKVVESGLAICRDDKDGVTYDRFRDRLMFPLCDLSGRIVAFAGRAMSANEKAKYINSPETALYRKSQLLYGMHKARIEARAKGTLIIVEGYMDFLTLYQAGIKNVVAVSGTAFTRDHALLIKRYAQKVALVFDGDRAGQSAARRALFVIAPFGLQASVLTLPGGDDPDTFVKREGAAAFDKMLDSAKGAEDFLIDMFIAEGDDTPQSKSRTVDELMPYARSLTDAIVRDAFLKKLAERLSVGEKRVFDRLATADAPLSAYAAAAQPDGCHDVPYCHDAPDDPYYDDAPYPPDDWGGGQYGRPKARIGVLEERFLKILSADPRLIVSAKRHISPEILSDALSADIYSSMLEVYARDGNLDGLREACGNKPDVLHVLSELDKKPAPAAFLEDEVVLKIIQLRHEFLTAQMTRLNEELKICPSDKKGELLKRLNDCVAQRKELDS